MSSTRPEVPVDSAVEAPYSEQAPTGGRASPAAPAGDRRSKLLSDLSDFFAHRRRSRGIFLPLVRIDRSD